MFRRLMLLVFLIALAVFLYRAVGPDIKRYIKISRM